jgi:hypothetical protein
VSTAYSLPQTDTKTINSTNTKPRIAGGAKAKPNEFPYNTTDYNYTTHNFIC